MTHEEAIEEYKALSERWEDDDTSYDGMFYDLESLFIKLVGTERLR